MHFLSNIDSRWRLAQQRKNSENSGLPFINYLIYLKWCNMKKETEEKNETKDASDISYLVQ